MGRAVCPLKNCLPWYTVRVGDNSYVSYAPRSRLRSSTSTLHTTMLRWTLLFLVIAVIAGLLGFTGVAGTASEIAKVLFFVFLVLLIISALVSALRGRPPV